MNKEILIFSAYSNTLLLSCIFDDKRAARNVTATTIAAGKSKMVWTNKVYIGIAHKDATWNRLLMIP